MTSNSVYKFDVLLDILEEDAKGLSSVARDKNCFKLRQNLKKKVVVTVTQLTNRHLIIERYGVLFLLFVVVLLMYYCCYSAQGFGHTGDHFQLLSVT